MGRTSIKLPLLGLHAILHVQALMSTANCPCRDLYCERGVIQAADGSALWKQDASSVLAAVYGPKQASLRKEDAERAVVEVIFKGASGNSGACGSAKRAACHMPQQLRLIASQATQHNAQGHPVDQLLGMHRCQGARERVHHSENDRGCRAHGATPSDSSQHHRAGETCLPAPCHATQVPRCTWLLLWVLVAAGR